jgi:hypothetical protein
LWKFRRVIKSVDLKRHFLLLLLFCSPLIVFTQIVYQDVNYTNIYDFLDELANLGVIQLHSAVKPYSRKYIAGKLEEALLKTDQLNKRQTRELKFYLRDYNLELKPDLAYSKELPGLFRKRENFGIPLSPLSFIYKDSLFTFYFRPIWGIKYFVNDSTTMYHRWGGAEIAGTIGKHFGFYASLRDNHENIIMVEPHYFTQDEGAVWKTSSKGGGDYSEMRGGITYSWKWGSVAAVKDHFQWGDNYNGSAIFSGRTPSFPYIQFHMKPLKWFEYTYIHGWLVSEVVDSSRSWQIPTGNREYFFNKYMAAALMGFTPWKDLDVTLGNSVIYSASYPNPAFLIPFLFFVNFSYSGNDFQRSYYGNNSQLFLNISSRQIKHLHLFGSVFIDGFKWDALTASNSHNFIGYKAGFKVSDFPLRNVSLTAEYTFTNPMTYKYSVPTLTFASNLYNLGSFMRDNSQDIYIALGYQPVRNLRITMSYELQEHGQDLAYTQVADPYTVPVLSGLTWKNRNIGISASYEFINNAFLVLEYFNRQTPVNDGYAPPALPGNTNMVNAGFNIGF